MTIEAERSLRECEDQAEQSTWRIRLPRRVMRTKDRPVAAVEHGVMAAAPGQRPRVAVARRAVEILAKAARAMRLPAPSWRG